MSPNSSVGSDIFALLSLLSISLLVLLLLRHFLPLRTTPAYLLVPIFLSLALPISIILLVPVDLASSLRTDDEASRGIWLPNDVLLVVWRIGYWLTFSLTWLILPLLGEYVDSGYRAPRDRITYSLRSNARYQLIVLGCGATGLMYVSLQIGFRGTSVKSLVMALAYCWGLIQAIYLMGHGLVAVPRRLFRNADTSGKLRRIQSRAPKVHDRMEDSMVELDVLEYQVAQLNARKHGISRDHQEWVQELADLTWTSPSRIRATQDSRPASPSIPAVITDRYLADLSRRLDRARHKRVRFVDGWSRLVQEAVDTQAILDSCASKSLDFGKATPTTSGLERMNILTPYVRYVLHSRVLPPARILFGTILCVASVCIIWSEIIKFWAPELSAISFTVVRYHTGGDGKVGFGGQLTASFWLFYMCAAALASFDDVKVWGNRALVRRNTYAESACWYAGQIAKLTVPLAYNFITFLPISVHSKTTFYSFLGRLIVLTPLGKGFDYFFPILILVPVCATLFNCYGRIKGIFGFGVLKDDGQENPSGFGTGGWREGQDLIDRELNSRLTGSSTPLDGIISMPPKGSQSSHRTPQRGSAAPHTASGTRVPSVPKTRITPRARQPPSSAANENDDMEDENTISGFAHRVHNTINGVRKSDWLPDLGRRPNWMGGAEAAPEANERADAGRRLGRWFGGRPLDGRVRL